MQEKPRKKYVQPPEIKVNKSCPVCSGKGQRKDERTGKLRDCVICKGLGIVKL